MDIRYSDTEKDGFHGAYYPAPGGSVSAFIYMLGPSVSGLLVRAGVMWLHPLTEDESIKVEDITGTLIFAGAEDDCLWDTCRYIRRMKRRLSEHGAECRCEAYTYRHATHFIFPDSMLKKKLHCLSGLPVMMFREGRRHRRECRESRIDFDCRIRNVILGWKNS